MKTNGSPSLRDRLALPVRDIPRSGIRDFFDIVSTMRDVISLGIGEPDFDTPWPVRESTVFAIERGATHYTSNLGYLELRQALVGYVHKKFGVGYNPATEVLVTVGVAGLEGGDRGADHHLHLAVGQERHLALDLLALAAHLVELVDDGVAELALGCLEREDPRGGALGEDGEGQERERGHHRSPSFQNTIAPTPTSIAANVKYPTARWAWAKVFWF